MRGCLLFQQVNTKWLKTAFGWKWRSLAVRRSSPRSIYYCRYHDQNFITGSCLYCRNKQMRKTLETLMKLVYISAVIICIYLIGLVAYWWKI